MKGAGNRISKKCQKLLDTSPLSFCGSLCCSRVFGGFSCVFLSVVLVFSVVFLSVVLVFLVVFRVFPKISSLPQVG